MFGRVPVSAGFVAGVFDDAVFGLHIAARAGVRQIGKSQVHSCDPREALIVRVQRPRHGPQPRHDSLDRRISSIGTAKQAFDFIPFPHHELLISPFDQRRATEHETICRAGNPEIFVAGLAQTPHVKSHFGPRNGTIVYQNIYLMSMI